MKIATIFGTRPELIRLSKIIPLVDKHFEQILIHTGQNYDFELDEIFMNEFNFRKPDYYLGAKGTFTNQISIIFKKTEKIFLKEKPDALLVLGDTNSSLAAVVAKRLNIKVFHMEAGNRCYDDRVPEEINRRIIDHSSDVLLPYTDRSASNLVEEGIERKRIYVTGNPIFEVLNNSTYKINQSKILNKLKIQKNKYFLVTLHREENVDNLKRLKSFINIFQKIIDNFKFKIIWPIHPRSKKLLEKINLSFDKNKIVIIKPVGFHDFVKLELQSFCILTDSGTVQEECSIFKKPVLTLRDTTERPETVESGSNIIISNNIDNIVEAIKFSTNKSVITNTRTPDEYLVKNVSNTIIKILLSKINQ